MFLYEVALEAVRITAIVFVMMLLIDFVDVKSGGRFRALVQGGLWRQYATASFLGATPGCLGAFMNVSMYVHGLLSFGAITAGMIATSGDEALVMLARFPAQAVMLFAILFLLAIPLGWLTDRLITTIGYVPCQTCHLQRIHADEGRRGHYLAEHIWKHIIKRHIFRIFLWTLAALLVVKGGLKFWGLRNFVEGNLGMVLIVSALIGIIPESGPHLVFVMLYAEGLVPFSVLLASSISQDGHGLLPLLSYSVKDALAIKAINVVAALVVGGVVYLLGG